MLCKDFCIRCKEQYASGWEYNDESDWERGIV